MRLFAQLYWYFLIEWRRYFGAIMLLIIIAGLQLIPPRLVGLIIDGINKHTISNKQLFGWISAIVFITCIIYGLRYIWRLWLFGASYKLAVQLRQQFYHQFSRQTPEFYLRYRVGDLMARTTNDVDRVVFAAGDGVLTLIDSLVMGCTVLIFMSIEISWKLTLLSLLPMPIMACFIKRYGAQLYTRFKSAQSAFSSLNNHAQESLTSIRMIKAFGLENRQSHHFEMAVLEAGRKNMHVAQIDAKFDPTIYIAISAANFLAVVGGSWMVYHNTMTLGELTSFIMYLGLMIWPMLALAWMLNIVERGSAAYSRICVLFDESPSIIDGEQCLKPTSSPLIINIRQFHYPGAAIPALHNIAFNIQPGQLVGITGPTGSGKSTLLSLMQRHFDVIDGAIIFQSFSLIDIQHKEWYSTLAVVNQIPFLFSDTIAGNIALGKPTATQKAIEEVARIADVHEDILRLPDGYNTQVGERGIMLSGGQKQRISIARALLLDSRILILDDALSSVDAETENRILKNLHQWRGGRTIIMSTNRLSALADADQIIVLQNGTIVCQGTHQKLIAKTGWYQDMYCYQQIETSLEHEHENE
ncbi:MAG: SmdA family multidrug ABC transporter permease/ATP-binding protein [Candidatus Arsenophonus melophagi]|nr:SmdA family multidrug ABC transporter permease/ATP-binding protein [Candidatus Arsenophonus melophagi]